MEDNIVKVEKIGKRFDEIDIYVFFWVIKCCLFDDLIGVKIDGMWEENRLVLGDYIMIKVKEKIVELLLGKLIGNVSKIWFLNVY